MKYLDSDTIADAIEALRHRVPIERIAGRLRVSVPELKSVMGLPVASDETNAEVDLWQIERFNSQL
jgi:hypothetical protein